MGFLVNSSLRKEGCRATKLGAFQAGSRWDHWVPLEPSSGRVGGASAGLRVEIWLKKPRNGGLTRKMEGSLRQARFSWLGEGGARWRREARWKLLRRRDDGAVGPRARRVAVFEVGGPVWFKEMLSRPNLTRHWLVHLE